MRDGALAKDLRAFLAQDSPRDWKSASDRVLDWRRSYLRSSRVLLYLFGLPLLSGWSYLAYRQTRDGVRGVLGWGEVAGSLVIYAFGFWLLWRVCRWGFGRVASRDAARIEELRTASLQPARVVSTRRTRMQRVNTAGSEPILEVWIDIDREPRFCRLRMSQPSEAAPVATTDTPVEAAHLESGDLWIIVDQRFVELVPAHLRRSESSGP